MTEQFHQCRKIDSAAKHLAGIGVSELMRDDAAGNARRSSSFAQVGAQFADEYLPGTRPRHQMTVRGGGSSERKKRKRWTRSRVKESMGTMRSVFNLPSGTCSVH